MVAGTTVTMDEATPRIVTSRATCATMRGPTTIPAVKGIGRATRTAVTQTTIVARGTTISAQLSIVQTTTAAQGTIGVVIGCSLMGAGDTTVRVVVTVKGDLIGTGATMARVVATTRGGTIRFLVSTTATGRIVPAIGHIRTVHTVGRITNISRSR